ncbi:putative quinol monooxygenase [Arenibacter amylolyticus]|uniref:putative quinol monooxygenase n=1 Tax=Arenibacter amylolyticus TaxID=1406873 RepID=UPI000A378A60|nr:antibiotic biosynthesis monooxygenase [Arenibacter amylolyticus]
MMVRIVKLTFKSENITSFKSLFEKHRIAMQKVDGCTFLELLQDIEDPRVFFTHSHWKSKAHLEAYRKSEYFGQIWKKTKLLFEEKPEAWSLEKQ